MRSERTKMAFKERISRIIEFPDTILLVYIFLASGQIVVEL